MSNSTANDLLVHFNNEHIVGDNANDFKIEISLEEYFTLHDGKGHKWITIDINRAQAIFHQHGWEKLFYIEPIEGSPVFKLWRIEDYLHSQKLIAERVAKAKVEIKKESVKKAEETHDKYMEWKRMTRKKLLDKVIAGQLKVDMVERLISEVDKYHRADEAKRATMSDFARKAWEKLAPPPYYSDIKATDEEKEISKLLE